jgi:hypothetical protein
MRLLHRFRMSRRAMIPPLEVSQLIDDSLPICMQFYTFASGSLSSQRLFLPQTSREMPRGCSLSPRPSFLRT